MTRGEVTTIEEVRITCSHCGKGFTPMALRAHREELSAAATGAGSWLEDRQALQEVLDDPHIQEEDESG